MAGQWKIVLSSCQIACNFSVAPPSWNYTKLKRKRCIHETIFSFCVLNCEIMSFYHTRTSIIHKYTINGRSLYRVTTFCDLGVMIDMKLSFVANKTTLYALRRLPRRDRFLLSSNGMRCRLMHIDTLEHRRLVSNLPYRPEWHRNNYIHKKPVNFINANVTIFLNATIENNLRTNWMS